MSLFQKNVLKKAQAEVGGLDNEINRMVYGLTEEEIKIVEGC